MPFLIIDELLLVEKISHESNILFVQIAANVSRLDAIILKLSKNLNCSLPTDLLKEYTFLHSLQLWLFIKA